MFFLLFRAVLLIRNDLFRIRIQLLLFNEFRILETIQIR